MNTKYEPCSICEKYIDGVICDEDNCPVAKMKAEIERLTVELKAMRGAANSYKMHYNNAIKEFAERLKEKPIKCGLPLLGLQTKEEIEEYFDSVMLQVKDAIDNLVKEMTEGN